MSRIFLDRQKLIAKQTELDLLKQKLMLLFVVASMVIFAFGYTVGSHDAYQTVKQETAKR